MKDVEIHIKGIGSADLIENIATEITEDRAVYNSGRNVAAQIAGYTAYPIVESEIKNAIAHDANISRILNIPVNIDGRTSTIHIVMETKDNSLHINLIGNLSESLLEESGNILSKSII